jgi:AraC-like DNA-binding protein
MKKEIPKITFNKNQNLNIEVMNFAQLFNKLKSSSDHYPFAVHKIEFFLIMITFNNSYTHFVDFKPYELTPGSALFIAKNQVHHFTKDVEKAEGICIIFNSLFTDKHQFSSDNLKLNRLFNYHIETPLILKEELREDKLTDIATLLYNEYNSPNPFAKSELLSTLLQALLLKAERAKDFRSISSVKLHWLELFSSFKNLLEEEYVNTRNSKDYASKLFISYKFLNDIVKELTGKTAKAFIDHFVCMEIKRFLVSTSLSIKEISYQSGFEDSGNMVKFFKKNMAITPLKFRQQK